MARICEGPRYLAHFGGTDVGVRERRAAEELRPSVGDEAPAVEGVRAAAAVAIGLTDQAGEDRRSRALTH